MGKFFSNESTFKIISIMVALILWMYVMNEQNPQVTYVVRDVPVRMENLDTDKFALKDNSQTYAVNVKVRGRRSLITNLKSNDIDAVVNLRGRMEGDNLLPLSVNVPNNIELVDFSPKEIMVSLDAIIEEQMPVTVEIKGTPASGYAYQSPTSKPSAVVVKGPRTMVNAVKRVMAQADVDGKNQTFTSILPLRVLDGQGKDQKNIEFRPDVVEVTVPIIPVTSVSITPVVSGSPAEGFVVKNISSDPSAVVVTGDPDVLNQLSTVNSETLNIDGYMRDVTREVKIVFPEGIKALDEKATTVKITVEIEKLETRTYSFSPDEISIQGLADNLRANIVDRDNRVVITVNGPQSVIDRLNKNMIKLYVDVNGLSQGEHEVEIQTEIAAPYEIINIEPNVIGISIDSRD